MIDLQYQAGGRTLHSVCIGRGAWRQLQRLWLQDWRQAVIVGDERVLRLFAGRVEELLRPLVDRVKVLGFPAGEANKNRATKRRLEDAMLRAGLGRDCCLVALGGGVSLDLGGFVAATYLRGIDSIYLPTTLLAQVDAALGGKTAVNTPAGKNLIGAFHQPQAILMEPESTRSLPPGQWRNGLAELVKHAVIGDATLFRRLEERAGRLARPGSLGERLLQRAVQVKLEVVEQDERERGRRVILNFGHTVAHALEAASGWRLGHGRAVARGLVVEARLAELLGVARAGTARRLRLLLDRLGLARGRWPAWSRLRPYLARDKKNRAGRLRLPLLRRIGRMACDLEWSFPVDERDLERAWRNDLRQPG
ncbi:MAG: 3-dehydroquinate synthase [Deltaproteobacteria bacterium]|nr:MAG: 3-dehydroquinate synthase [Deltaproteobacteria bacterium]